MAVRSLAHAEALGARVKFLRICASEAAESKSAASAAAAAAPAVGGAKSAVAEGGKGGGKGGKQQQEAAPAQKKGPDDGIEAQLGGAAALEDEAETELVAVIAERELVSSGAGTLGGHFLPLLTSIARASLTSGAAETQLEHSALLALAKFSAVSRALCTSQLQLLFTLLGHSPSASVRSLLAVALGDLAFRFPNELEPYQHLLYARLRDADGGVRKNTLLVLSHLILNGMVKIKGQVGELAVCLNDADPTISGVTRMVRPFRFPLHCP
jgi:condensin complex subunit 1